MHLLDIRGYVHRCAYVVHRLARKSVLKLPIIRCQTLSHAIHALKIYSLFMHLIQMHLFYDLFNDMSIT